MRQKKPTIKHAFLDKEAESKICPSCHQTFYRDKRCTRSYWTKAKYCSRECFGFADARRRIEARLTIQQEFERYVVRADGCWEWSGLKDKDGYALLQHARKMHRAAILSLKFDGRPPLRGEYACHHCDNPACVRPDHLFPGTPKQNSEDAKAKGRHMHGEGSPLSKLTEADVRAIRTSAEKPREIAKRFGVTPGNVYSVRARKTWTHVA